ncbi:MAG TPA: type IV toxin-antitoxin system AbiEi family antitoxin domain-containing protein [Candidatus Lachnoclostridium stercoravium]|uniref:Type IV toxin-antitoxin system AbiEi family antitoxin domain-containing protein n=1 Tax=Candidatus Lachnoclostridium stercoravium TaxID=2838633 RepID=A0A9D2HIR4_9FIRM|nr:type IV toxin-antitoxin system AbiEi family antitoxin domain-containing protein [Candidatus Lachnoclostridium stercoravium]
MEKELQDLFASHGGILKTSELLQCGCYYRKIQELINDGEIEQVRRGYYQRIDDNSYSEVAVIVRLFPDAVLCMESALDYYGYTERTPSSWNLAVLDSSSRRRFNISWPIVKPHFISESKFPVGIVEAEIEGTNMRIYDRERTICDCLTHRNKMNAEVFNNAIRGYLKDPRRKESRLGMYAAALRVQRKVREVLGIWL